MSPISSDPVVVTVMPPPENETVAPLTKLVPVTVTVLVVPASPVVGEADVAVGAGRITVKQPEQVADCVSGLGRSGLWNEPGLRWCC